MFAVGAGGTALHYNGAVWEKMETGTSKSVFASPGGEVFSVGANGTVLEYVAPPTGIRARTSPSWPARSGVYLCRLRAGPDVVTRKVVRVK